MTIKTLLLATAVAAGFSGAASAATYYATTVVEYTPGAGITDPWRMITDHALGAPDEEFLSLGLGGSAVFTFGRAFTGPGNVYEITYSRPGYTETASVFGSVDGVTYDWIADINNVDENSSFTFAGTYNYLKVWDNSPSRPGRDGFDIDAVSVSAVPIPAAGLLLAGGLGLLGGARRLRRKA